MKHLILLSFFPLILFGQYTNIPDQNFELALLNLGYDFVIDGVVETSIEEAEDISNNFVNGVPWVY